MKTITEKQIHLIARRLNAKKPLKEVEDLNNLAPEGEVKVTKEQAQKGFEWLMNQYKTPKKIERKNNPFGYREQEALDSGLDYFTFDGMYDAGNMNFSFYLPIYTFIGKSGGSFQYYVSGGKINIIG
jgi:hypothetical protein